MEFTAPDRTKPLFRDNPILAGFPARDMVTEDSLRGVLRDYRPFVVFIVQRSGSTWLFELMRNTGLFGRPREALNADYLASGKAFHDLTPDGGRIEDIDQYLRRYCAVTAARNGAVGTKLSIFHARTLCGMLPQPEGWEGLLPFFYLRRADIVAQAVSSYRADVLRTYHSFQMTRDELARHRSMPLDEEEVLAWVRRLVVMERDFEAFFRRRGLAPVRLVYETVEADPAAVLHEMAGRILGDAVSPRVRWLMIEGSIRLRRTRTRVLRADSDAARIERLRSVHADRIAEMVADRPGL